MLSRVAPKFLSAFRGRPPLKGDERSIIRLHFEASLPDFCLQHLVANSSQLVVSKVSGSKRLRRAMSLGSRSSSLSNNLVSK